MTDRPRILDLPGGPVVVDDWVRTGWGDSIPLIDAYLGIDTDALKLTALNLYGIPAQHDNTGRSTDPGVDANLEIDSGGKLFVGLIDVARSVERDFGDVVDHWQGPARESAEARRVGLADVVFEEANHARRIGQSLWHFADVLERGKGDITAAVVGGAELGMSAHGLATAGERLARSIAIVGILLDIVDSLMSHQEELRHELEQVSRANDQLAELLDTSDPTRQLPDVSKDTHDWDVE